MGRSASTKPSERLRAGRKPARGLSFVAVEDGRVVGTVRLWEVAAGPACSALLLGPLAVDPAHRRRGIGSALMRHALRAAARRGHRAVLLVGDAPYYGRFGFSAERTAGLWLPGLADRSRLLAPRTGAGRARRRARRDPRAEPSRGFRLLPRSQASSGPNRKPLKLSLHRNAAPAQGRRAGSLWL